MAQLKDLIVNGASRLIGDVYISGDVTSTTPAAGTNDTKVATTAFVKTAVDNAINNAKQTKTVTPSTSAQNVDPDSGKILSRVTVNAIPNQQSASGNVTLDATTTSKSYPAGYYANAHGAQHSTVTRATTTISKSADTINKKITFTASNDQGTGYVTGANKTATATATLSISGKTATMTDGTNSVTADVATGSAKTPATTIVQSTPTMSGAVSGSNYVVTASVAQKTQSVTPTVSAGYVSSGTAGTITLSASSNTLNLPVYNGEIYAE